MITAKRLLTHAGVALGLLCLLSFTLFYTVLPAITNKNKVVSVPDVKGMTVSQATKFLQGHDLDIGMIDSSFDSELPAVTILYQYPKANSKVKVYRKINLTLNMLRSPEILFPDLTGSTFDFAQRQLQTLDLKIGTIKYRQDIAHNTVLESRIGNAVIHAGDHVRKGTTIDLMLATFNDKFALPNFVGMQADNAEAFILGADLIVKEIHFGDAGNIPLEMATVTKQLPSASDTVKVGDAVEIWVTGN